MEVDLVYEYLKAVLRKNEIKKAMRKLMEISPSDFTSPEDVLAEMYIHLKRKENDLLRAEVQFRDAYITAVVKNKLTDLIKKYLRRRSRFIPSGSLDDLAGGTRVPSLGPVAEIALREKVDHLVEEILRAEWEQKVVREAVDLSGVFSAPESGIGLKLEELRAVEFENDVVHRSLIRALCSRDGISPSSATRLINALKVYFGLREVA